MMHLIPLSPAHRQQWVRGLQWCRLSRQHQSLQQPKYSIFFQISYILNMSTLPWTLATQRCGRAAITSPNDANLQILKRSSQKQKFSCTLNSCCCVCYQYIVVSTHLISMQWREGHRFYYASNSLKQSMWSYRHFWASEFVSTKDTKNTNLAPE